MSKMYNSNSGQSFHREEKEPQNEHARNNDQYSIEDSSQYDSFQLKYQLRQLQSRINELQIERQRIILAYENELEAQRNNITMLNNEKQQLIQDNQNLFEENQQVKYQYNSLLQEHENFQVENQRLRQCLESCNCKIRKTAEFINYDESPSSQQVSIHEQLKISKKDSKLQYTLEKDTSSYMEEGKMVSKLIETEEKYVKEIQNLKKNEIDIKRTYENMLQNKESIIRKLTNIQNGGSKRQLSQKNQQIAQLEKEINHYFTLLEQQRAHSETLQKKLATFESPLSQKKTEQTNQHSTNTKNKLVPNSQQQQLNIKEKMLITEMQRYINNLKSENFIYNQNRVIMEQAIRQLQESKSELEGKYQQQLQEKSQIKQEHHIQLKKMKQKVDKTEKELSQNQLLLVEKQKQIEIMMEQLKKSEECKDKGLSKETSHHEDIGHMLDDISEIQYRVKSSRETYINFEKENLKLKTTNQELVRSLESLNRKYQEKNEKMNKHEEILRQQYNQRIKGLQAEIVKLSKPTQQNSTISRVNSNIQRKSDTKQQLQRLKLVNEILQMQKIQKDEQIKKVKKNLQEKTNTLKIIEDNLKKSQKDNRDSKEDYRQLQIIYEDLQQKFKNGVKDLESQIQDMNDSLVNEKKKNDLKRQEYKKNQDKLLSEVKKLKNTINTLEEEIQDSKENKGKEMNEMEEKIQKLAHEILVINKQRQAMMKSNEIDMKNKCRVFEEERQKISQYVGQLQEKCQLLFDKIQQLERANDELTQHLNEIQQYQETYKTMQRDNYQLKVELSEALNEVTQTLQQYKDIQEKYNDSTYQQQLTREKYNSLHQKYRQLCQEKAKNIAQLDNCYDQIEKLNKVLMTKERQLVKNKTTSRWYPLSPSQNNGTISPSSYGNNISYSPQNTSSNSYSPTPITTNTGSESLKSPPTYKSNYQAFIPYNVMPRNVQNSPKKNMSIPLIESNVPKLQIDSPKYYPTNDSKQIVSPQQLKMCKLLKAENYSNANLFKKNVHSFYS